MRILKRFSQIVSSPNFKRYERALPVPKTHLWLCIFANVRKLIERAPSSRVTPTIAFGDRLSLAGRWNTWDIARGQVPHYNSSPIAV